MAINGHDFLSNHHAILIILISCVLMLTSINMAFAEHGTVEVSIPAGAAVEGCETTRQCYDPYEITIDVGDEVVWSNDDSIPHTVTSGNIRKSGPDGIFDSGVFHSGQTFARTFDEAGKFQYFCVVHPWMEGIVNVKEFATTDEPSSDDETSTDVDLVLSCGAGTTYDPSTNACVIGSTQISNTTLAMQLTLSGNIIDATLSVNDPIFDCGDLYITMHDVSNGQKTAYQQRAFFDQCYGYSGILPMREQFSEEFDEGQYIIEAQLFDKIGDAFLMVSQKFSVQDGIVESTDEPVISCSGGATYDLENNTCAFPTSQMATQSTTNNDALAIKEKFETSVREILFAPPTQSYADEFREFVGKDKYERWQKMSETVGAKLITQANYDGRTFDHPSKIFDFVMSGDTDLTLEEETALVESMEASQEFLKQTATRQLAQISSLADEAKDAINTLDITDEEKSQHIQEIIERKEYYTRVHTTGVSEVVLHSQDKIDKMKNKLQIKTDLIAKQSEPRCGEGTIEKNGICVAKTSGCLIATATYGTELAPQVQMLREIRDDSLYGTGAGTTFMAGFNEFYYSFSPTVADWERQSPLFKEVVKIAITPMLSAISIFNYVDIGSEQEVLGYGMGVILLNVGIYFVIPVIVILKIKSRQQIYFARTKSLLIL